MRKVGLARRLEKEMKLVRGAQGSRRGIDGVRKTGCSSSKGSDLPELLLGCGSNTEGK